MDFLDVAKHAQAEIAKADEETRLKNQEWSKVIIPDELAVKIADNIYYFMKEELLNQCTSKSGNIKSDEKLFSSNNNYRYEIGLPGADWNNKLTIVQAKSPFYQCGESYDEGNIFPKDNGFIYFCDSHGVIVDYSRYHHGPGALYYRNNESFAKIFTLLINKFKKQNLKYVFRYEYPNNEIVLVFYVIIPCDKSGNITV